MPAPTATKKIEDSGKRVVACARQVPIFRDDDVERDPLHAVLKQVRMPALRERVEAFDKSLFGLLADQALRYNSNTASVLGGARKTRRISGSVMGRSRLL
jgi:hypothetical protein